MKRRRNVAKLLARLNPKSLSLNDAGLGGIPVETALDIAGALGFAGQLGPGPYLAVLVLCIRWWPGLFEGPTKTVGYRLVHHNPKWHERLEAPLDVFLGGCCERIPIEAPSEAPAFGTIVSLLTTRLRGHAYTALDRADLEWRVKIAEAAKAASCGDPKAIKAATLAEKRALADIGVLNRMLWDETLGDWARAVIHEYRHPNHCQTCTPWAGHGHIGEVPKPVLGEGGKIVRVEWTTCETCYGGGVLAWSSKRRAKALGIGEHPFRNYLKTPHDGALALLRELEWRGARLVLRHLGFG
jgi:hypothetical protein